MNRKVVIDTETTGLDPKQDHRIVEVACVEMLNYHITGKEFHTYLNPQRMIDQGAKAVHGLDETTLANKPLFKEIAEDLWQFMAGAELIIHNAPFDLGFLQHEFQRANYGRDIHSCKIIDTLVLARQLHPGQHNNLDALCKRYSVDNSKRDLHGALIDARLLAQVYLLMTGGQIEIFSEEFTLPQEALQVSKAKENMHKDLVVLKASEEELRLHQEFIEKMNFEAT